MTAYLLRRLGTSIIVLIGISIFIFLLLHAIYPSPARDVLGLRANNAQIAAWNKDNGFDRPVIAQYLSYMNALLHGNLGYSYANNQTVASLFQERLARSIYLSGMALLIAILIALPLGIFQAVKRNSLGDNIATSAAFILYSMPVFALGLILIQVFAISFPLFSFEASQSTSIWTVIGDWRAMLLPILTLALISVALFSRYMRSSSIDVLAQDYIKVARAKGLPERLVLTRHMVRNASLPMVTLIGLSLPALLAGNLIVEYLFNYQGLGLLFYSCLGKADYPVLLAYTLIGAVQSGWRLAVREFSSNRLAVVGVGILVFFIVFCFIGPIFYHGNVENTDLINAHNPPGAGAPLGTDVNGLDILGQLMKGGQAALEIGFFAAFVAITIGALVGAVAGLAGGVVDTTLMRITDVFLSVPFLFVVLILAIRYGASVLSLSLVIGGFSWQVPARLVRGEVLTIRERDFVLAARAAGSGPWRLIGRHLLPNALGVMIVNVTFQVADAILAVAYVGFLGFGLHYPNIDWGDMLSDGTGYLTDGYWWLIWPVLTCIVLTVMALNFIGDALRDSLDVRLRRR